jgi:hypothetical protein
MRSVLRLAATMAVGVLLGHSVTRLRAWITAARPPAPRNWRAMFRNGERDDRL